MEKVINAGEVKAADSPPERVWITWDDCYAWETPETGGDEYVRADIASKPDSEDIKAEERKRIKAIILARRNLYALSKDYTSDTIRILCDQLLDAIEFEAADKDKNSV